MRRFEASSCKTTPKGHTFISHTAPNSISYKSLELPSWVVLYVRRWLAVDAVAADGTVTRRDRGTPQGGPVSPVLANLFLHYAFDAWMEREHPTVVFERYADDVIVHCVSGGQAERVLAAIEARMVGSFHL